jgi:hypothetical protein
MAATSRNTRGFHQKAQPRRSEVSGSVDMRSTEARKHGRDDTLSVCSVVVVAGGVGCGLARDLLGTGSKSRHLGRVRYGTFAGFAAASRQIVGKPTPTPSGQNQGGVRPYSLSCGQKRGIPDRTLSAFDSGRRPVGAGSSRELPGTGSKSRHLGRVRYSTFAGFAAASRQIVGKPTPTPSGQNQGGVRPDFMSSGQRAAGQN